MTCLYYDRDRDRDRYGKRNAQNRVIVAVLVEVGKGNMDPNSIPAILAARNRSAATGIHVHVCAHCCMDA